MISSDRSMRQLFDLVARVAPVVAGHHPGRDRHRQGAGRPGHPRALAARRDGPFVRGQLRRRSPRRSSRASCSATSAAPSPARSGCARALRGGRRRHPLPRRDWRAAARPAAEAPAGARGSVGEVKRVGASRPHHVDVACRRHQPRPARRGAGRQVPRGPVLPALRRARDGPAAPRPHRRRPAARRGLPGPGPPPGASPSAGAAEALARLEAYDWPGNVRQLRNVVQRALLFRGEGLAVPASAVTFEDTRAVPAVGPDDDTLYVRGLTKTAPVTTTPPRTDGAGGPQARTGGGGPAATGSKPAGELPGALLLHQAHAVQVVRLLGGLAAGGRHPVVGPRRTRWRWRCSPFTSMALTPMPSFTAVRLLLSWRGSTAAELLPVEVVGGVGRAGVVEVARRDEREHRLGVPRLDGLPVLVDDGDNRAGVVVVGGSRCRGSGARRTRRRATRR